MFSGCADMQREVFLGRSLQTDTSFSKRQQQQPQFSSLIAPAAGSLPALQSEHIRCTSIYKFTPTKYMKQNYFSETTTADAEQV